MHKLNDIHNSLIDLNNIRGTSQRDKQIFIIFDCDSNGYNYRDQSICERDYQELVNKLMSE